MVRVCWHVGVNVYIYIHILGSGARFARALAYRVALRRHMTADLLRQTYYGRCNGRWIYIYMYIYSGRYITAYTCIYINLLRHTYYSRHSTADTSRHVYHGRYVTADISRQLYRLYGRYISSDILRQIYYGRYVTADM